MGGLTARGNPFDTCCKSCAISKGNPMSHDFECDQRNGVFYKGKKRKKSFKKRAKKKKTLKKRKAFKHAFYTNTTSNNVNSMNSFSFGSLSSFSSNNHNNNGGFGNNALNISKPISNDTLLFLGRFGNNVNNNNTNNNNVNFASDLSVLSNKRINYLELDDYMTAVDDKSLNKLTTAQLIQRLRSNGLDYKGLKHQLIQRWKKYKIEQAKTGTKMMLD